MIIIITNQNLEKYKTDFKKHVVFSLWGVSIFIFYGGWAGVRHWAEPIKNPRNQTILNTQTEPTTEAKRG